MLRDTGCGWKIRNPYYLKNNARHDILSATVKVADSCPPGKYSRLDQKTILREITP